AKALFEVGKTNAALAQATEAEGLALRLLGPEHPATFEAWAILGQIALRQGDYERAEVLFRRVLEGREALLGPLDPETIRSLLRLARALHGQRRLEEARLLYMDEIDRCHRYYGITHLKVSFPLGHVFWVLRDQHDSIALRDFCQQWLREVLAIPAGPDRFERDRRRITLYHLAQGLATLPEPVPIDAELAVRAAEELGNRAVSSLLYYRIGQLGKAEEVIELAPQSPGTDPGWNWMTRALLHAHRGQRQQAREFYDRAVKWRSEHSPPPNPNALVL